MHAGPALPPCPRAVPRCQMLKLPPAADTSITTKYDHSHGVALLRSYARYRYGAQSTHALASKAHTTSHTALSLVDAAAGRAQRSLRSVVHVSHALSRRPGDTSRASDGPSTPRQANRSPPTVSHRCREAPAAMRSSSQAFQMRTLLSSGPFSPLASAWPTSPSLRPWAGRPTPGARRRSS